jgi:diguanylate cyclase (GGDEF)-like protein/PAS domain S-box-containing protein
MSADTELIADLADAVPGALYRIDSSGYGEWSFSFLSNGIEELYGFSAAEVLADPMVLNRCMLEEDLPGYAQANIVAFESLSVLDYEYRIKTRVGEFRWIGVRAVPRHLDDGTVAWSGIMLDITRRKQTEEALASSELRFRAVFEAAPQGIVLRDRLGKVVDANPAALRLLETSLTDLLTQPAMHPLFDAIGTNGSVIDADEHPGLITLRTGQRSESKVLGASVGLGKKQRVWLRVNATPIVRDGAIDRVVSTLEDVTDGVELTQKMRQEAETDFLTQLLNRRSFMARLSAEVERLTLGDDRCSALLAIDLDHFKVVNDTYGHAAGDAVLVHAADVITESVRASDAVARSGGEEFLVLLPDTTPEGAISIAERIRAGFEERPTDFEGTAIEVTASIGLSLIDREDSDGSELLVRADTALYEAKSAGRNAVVAGWL